MRYELDPAERNRQNRIFLKWQGEPTIEPPYRIDPKYEQRDRQAITTFYHHINDTLAMILATDNPIPPPVAAAVRDLNNPDGYIHILPAPRNLNAFVLPVLADFGKRDLRTVNDKLIGLVIDPSREELSWHHRLREHEATRIAEALQATFLSYQEHILDTDTALLKRSSFRPVG